MKGRRCESEEFLCLQKQEMDESGAGDSIRVVASWQSIYVPLPDGDRRTGSLSVWDKIEPKREYLRFESQDDSQIL